MFLFSDDFFGFGVEYETRFGVFIVIECISAYGYGGKGGCDFLMTGGGAVFFEDLGGVFSTGPAMRVAMSTGLVPEHLRPLALHISFSSLADILLSASSDRS